MDDARHIRWPVRFRWRPQARGPSVAPFALAGVLLTGVPIAVAVGSDSDNPVDAAFDALGVALLISVGGYAWARRASRFGFLLVGAGATLAVVSLSLSRDETVYSVGRIAGFVGGTFVVYILLAFPRGRLESDAARIVMAAGVIVLVLLFLATIPLMREFPADFPWGGCTDDCPRNAFFAGHQPGVMSVVEPLREGLASAIVLSAIGVLALRVRAATRLMRRTLLPVLAAGIVWLVALVGLFLAPSLPPAVVDVVNWALLIALPLIAVGMLAGMLTWRFSEGPALARLVQRLGVHPEPDELRDAMSDALEDPSLEIAYRVGPGTGTGFADADGNSVALDRLGSARAVTRVFRDGEPIAAIVHDPALGERSELVDAAGTAALLVLDQQRLDAQLRASVRELRSSQARILAAADVERQRIERDLHDGAQQRLVALRMKLELMNELRSTDPARAAVLETELGGEIDGALDEIRGLARGIYPPLLASHGLGEALDAVAVRCPVPTTVLVDGDRRYPREVESAVYFCCREALQNVAKHAEGATRATIRVVGDDRRLSFAIRDDGAGFDVERTDAGAGLVNIHDRVAVAGGELEVRSRVGAGTTVTARIPLRGPGRSS